MEKLLEITLQSRKRYLALLQQTPRLQLLQIPEGFSNNIWWNIAHVLVVQQILVYGLSKLPFYIDGALVPKFKRGSFPDGTVTEAELQNVADALVPAIERTWEDYCQGRFTEYEPYTTLAGATLTKVEDAIAFNLFHEGLHWGTVMALQKKVGR